MARKAFVHEAATLIAVAPDLPSNKPTASAWQLPPHPTVANHQSPSLPQESDVVVIGSGITGVSVARHLLQLSKVNSSSSSAARRPLRVTILEARTAVSGATGRNGGHLLADSELLFPPLVQDFGLDKATEVVRFNEDNITSLTQLVAQLPDNEREAAEFRTLATNTAYKDDQVFQESVDAARQLRKLLPDSTIEYVFLDGQEAEKALGFKSEIVAGVVQQKGVAALSPYRLLTHVLATMLRDYSDQFSLEANTPVLEIDHDKANHDRSRPYTIRTPRGTIRATHVVHATNGYAAALIPGLVGKLYPVRGTMSAQRLGPQFPRVGHQISWSHLAPASYDPSTGHMHLGLYYAQQHPRTGVMFVGGESQRLQGLLTSDDSFVADDARRTLSAAPGQIWRHAAPTEPLHVWSGIMGFTGDGLPLVGKLDEGLTGRAGDGEWIAAGYNGHGMDKAWLTGEALARMILGEPAGDVVLPSLFRVSAERVSSWTPTMAAENMADHVKVEDDTVSGESKL